jgi:LuxR family transcriptional regulator, maltose regulon positive regulatory protein
VSGDFGTANTPSRSRSGLRAVKVPVPRRADFDVPIETKFQAPGLRRDLVERPELVQHLAAATAKLILVDASAGFGKTTLVAQWQASTMESRPFAWLSLDDGENDPSRLWWHIIHALQKVCPGLVGEENHRQLRADDPDITGTVLPTLLNELTGLTAPVILVLDDYQAVTDPSCHEQMAFFLLHLPASIQVVLITRTSPPLPVARWRASGEMAELGARELRFTPAQAALLVQMISAAELSISDIAMLVERTEGWPASLYLAALSLRGHAAPSAFVRQFSGDNRFITDFLAEEVLSREPAEIRQFLVRTSILGRFSAPLCDAVLGSTNAAEILDTLDRENLFVVPLDEIRQWFRYHRMFAQMLRGYLDRTEPGVVATLHERASAWHRRSGSVEETIRHAVAAGNLTEVVEIIASQWPAYVDSGQVATVRGWLDLLGDQAIRANPLAAHCAAWIAALSGDRETLRHWLAVMQAGKREESLPDGMRSLTSSAALLRGAFGFDGLRTMRESAVAAAELESDPASPWYALARTAVGLSRYLSGDPKAAEEPLEEAVSSEAAIPLVRMLASSMLCLTAVELGKLARAQDLADDALRLGTRDGASETQSSLAYMAVGAVYTAQGRLQEARDALEHAVQSRQRVPGIGPWPTIIAMELLAQVRLDLGDRPGSAALVDQARLLLTSFQDGAGILLARLERLEQQAAGQPKPVPFAEPLTEREVAVLHLLQGTLSLREIGQELHLSPNTIKTHAQAIYRKLGVSTRHDAVKRGRQVGRLLPGGDQISWSCLARRTASFRCAADSLR